MAKPLQYTEWYAPTQQPKREGVYQRKMNRSIMYGYWNGKFWGIATFDPDSALMLSSRESVLQCLDWRGLAKKAK